MTYTIAVVSPFGYGHSEVFNEVALGLQGGFKELGMAVDIVKYPGTRPVVGRGIFLGVNIIPAFKEIQLPASAIIFNLEQVTDTSGWLNDEYLRLLKTHEVWDYSRSNMSRLIQRGVCDVRYCGIGYAQCLTKIEPTVEDVDVLFYGSIFGRRLPILDAVDSTGLRVHRLFGVYGAERDAWIARSKVVLNLHAYHEQVFEIVRVSYLWANRKCVISERAPDIPSWMYAGLITGNADSLPNLCQLAAADVNLRTTVAEEGFQLFHDTRQSDYLRAVITVPLAQ